MTRMTAMVGAASPFFLLVALTARTADAADAPPTPRPGLGEGFALDLSAGPGGAPNVGQGGGLMAALSWQRRGLGFGAFGAAMGSSGPEKKGSDRKDSASLLGGGALVSWVGREGRVVPLLGAGLGWAWLGMTRANLIGVFEGKGPFVLARAGILAPRVNAFATLRADVPLFAAEHELTSRTDRVPLAVVAEIGIRLGD